MEFQLAEAKSETAACRARVNLIVSRLDSEKKKAKHDESSRSLPPDSIPNGSTTSTTKNETNRVSSLFADDNDDGARPLLESDRIASGDSEAIALRPPGNRGYLPIDLWDIILRIIGFGRVAVQKSVRDNTPSAMII